MATDECPDRPQSAGEEIANSVSHGVGLLASAVALPVLISSANAASAVVGATVFGVSLLLLYFSSTLYHALSPSRAKRLFQVLDHGAIYLLIAGTYTPFTLGVLRGPWGWSLFAVIWCLALTGATLKTIAACRDGAIRGGWISTALYVAMGWLVLIAVRPLWKALPGWGTFWLLAGGLSYTA